jgi:hypothetical protein
MFERLKDMLVVNGITTVVVRDANLVAIVVADADNKVIIILALIPEAYCRGRYNLCILHIVILLVICIIVVIGGHSL